MKLISTPKQALNNIIELNLSLQKPSYKKQAKSLLKNGKIFVVAKINGDWLFAPSRFVGYKNNTLKKHRKAMNNKIVDGRKTERTFDQYFQLIDSSRSEYSILEKAYLDLCMREGFYPSKHHKERKYRIYSENSVELEFDLKQDTSSLTKESHIKRMARTTFQTVKNSEKKITKISKNKQTNLTKLELENHITKLLSDQNWKCALTNLSMVINGDPQRFPSLDRINSEKHYTKDNLQIVCKFANKWKSNATDEEFKRLISLLRTV